MLSFFKKKPFAGEMMCVEWNNEADRLESIYIGAKHIDGCEPSVDGNKVIFYAPEMESKIEEKSNGVTLVMYTGSVELDMRNSRKIYKNDQGQTIRIEIFRQNRPKICLD